MCESRFQMLGTAGYHFGMSCAGHLLNQVYMMPQEDRGLAMWQVQAD